MMPGEPDTAHNPGTPAAGATTPTPAGTDAFADADRVRAHLGVLAAAGVDWQRAAGQADLPARVVRTLLHGQPTRGQAPPRRVKAALAQALLAVTAPPADARGEEVELLRLVRGMVAAGYPQAWVARRLGVPACEVDAAAGAVPTACAEAVRALADRCATVPGPSAQARAEAARHGWSVDLLWADSEDIFGTDDGSGDSAAFVVDQIAVERACAGERLPLNPAERRAAVDRLATAGYTATAIARRLRLSGATAQGLLEQAATDPTRTPEPESDAA